MNDTEADVSQLHFTHFKCSLVSGLCPLYNCSFCVCVEGLGGWVLSAVVDAAFCAFSCKPYKPQQCDNLSRRESDILRKKKRTDKGLQVCGHRIKKRDVMIPPGVRYVLRWPLLFIYESRPGEAWVNIDSSLGLRCSHWSTREGLITWSVRSGVGGGKARAGTRLSRWWSPLWCLFILMLVHLCNTGSQVTESSSTSRKWILGGYKL